MNQTQKNLAAINKLVVTVVVAITLAATLGNTIGVFKGEKTVTIAISFLLLGLTICFYSILLYRKNPSSEQLKYHVLYSFFILYAFTLLTTHRNIVFIYIIPIVYLYTMYYDVKLITITVSIFGVINIVGVANLMFIQKVDNGDAFMNYAVQVIASIVICFNAVMLTKLTKRINESNMQQLLDANKKQETILQEVLEIGSILDNRSVEMSTIVEELSISSDNMSGTMQRVACGILDSSKSITNQYDLTNNIQKVIANAFADAKKMSELSETSSSTIEEGVVMIKKLTENTKHMQNNGQEMASIMVSLMRKMKQVDQITEVINTIADQINLLSLNASIESARAGEAGRGFSIVASEIGNLATQTASSVSGIAEIITDLQNEIELLIQAGQSFDTLNFGQSQIIDTTEEVFQKMSSNMSEVKNKVSEVFHEMESILDNNQEIMKNISMLSEHSSSSNNLLATSKEDNEQVQLRINQTKQIADELLETSERLHVYL